MRTIPPQIAVRLLAWDPGPSCSTVAPAVSHSVFLFRRGDWEIDRGNRVRNIVTGRDRWIARVMWVSLAHILSVQLAIGD